MRYSTAVILTWAVHIATAAWHRNAEDTQYTIKAANIEAKVSCFVKFTRNHQLGNLFKPLSVYHLRCFNYQLVGQRQIG